MHGTQIVHLQALGARFKNKRAAIHLIIVIITIIVFKRGEGRVFP